MFGYVPRVTRERKLKEVLNVRLDEPLARELRRIAFDRDQTESEVARLLLSYGVEVSRRLDAARFSRPYKEDYRDRDEPGFVEIEARWRPATDDELIEMGYYAPADEPFEDEGSGS
jgi:hypothetical protein